MGGDLVKAVKRGGSQDHLCRTSGGLPVASLPRPVPHLRIIAAVTVSKACLTDGNPERGSCS